MKPQKRVTGVALAVIWLLLVALPVLIPGCSHQFPYQGSITGNWTGQLTILGRAIPVGGKISIKTDSKGVVSGTVSSTSGGANPATLNGEVDANGNLTGTLTLTLSATTFVSNWQGTVTAAGNSLGLQGTWTSPHGSGTFSGTGTSSK
jgi:hypothetical protein